MKSLKFRELFKGVIVLTLLLAILGALPTLSSALVSANDPPPGQNICPDGGEWIKIDELKGKTYTYNAPDGKVIIETCYKAGTTVKYETISPPQKSISITSDSQDLSHASFRLAQEPTPTHTSTSTMTPTSTATQPSTATATATYTATPVVETETPTETPTDEQVETPTPTDEQVETPTPTEEVETPTPTEEVETPAPTIVAVTFKEDPAPDQAAGGSGPSLFSILTPLLILISGLGVASVVIYINRKKAFSNND